MKRKIAICLVWALLMTICPMENVAVMAASDTGNQYSFTSDNNEVTISFREVKDNDYWYEYYITVTNQSSQSICDWSIEMNCSDVAQFSKGFECSATADSTAGTLTVKGSGNNKVVSAGSSVSSGESFKLGFGSAVTFSNAKITYSYGSQSSVEDISGGVGYGNTYLDGYSCKYTLTGEAQEMAWEDTPVGKHGSLHVSGTQLMDEHDQPTILRGASTHGMHWGEMTPFVNKAAFQNLRDEWGVDMVRLVSYVTQGGYTQGSQATLDAAIQNGVSYAEDLGLYAIIDWHIHAEDPNSSKDQAITFFDKYSEMYKDKDHVIYEICNEPTGTPWSSIKLYAEDIVDTIRANDKDAIIIVGTNTWSQDVDEVATNGGKLTDSNVMYTIHFYSGTHGQSLRDKVTTALNAGTPVFCTEFGICDASGNGSFDVEEANAWIDYFEEKGISYSCWSLCNKDESASMISPQSTKKSGWTNEDLGATGAWLINTYRSKRGEEPSVTPTQKPQGTSEPGTTPIITGKPAATDVPETPEMTTAPGETVLAKNLGEDVSYEASDMSWFTDGSDEDEITVVYTCTDSTHGNWGVLGWGATVDGEWVNGKEHMAGTIATQEITETITLGELKESLGVTENSTVSGLKLSAYNGGKIRWLSVKTEITTTATPVVSAAPSVKPDVTEQPEESTTPSVKPDVTEQPEESATPSVKPSNTQTPNPLQTQQPGGVVVEETNKEMEDIDMGEEAEEDEIEKGDYLIVGNLKYKVTKLRNGKGELALVGVKSKKVKTVTIPNKISKGDISFRVTSIAKKAFKGCKKLKKIKIKAVSMKRIAKKAFKGMRKNVRIKVPKSVAKKYKKMLKKSKYRTFKW